MTNGHGPLFSIVIPTSNYAHYLPRALDSILNQTEDDYEIIVVDDGSTDHTAEVIKAYASRVNCGLVYVFQENHGLAAARNHGVRLAKGDYLLFLDADDALLPKALERFRSAVEADPTLDFVLGGRIIVGTSGKITPRPARRLSPQNSQNFIRYLREDFETICPGSLTVHRRVFERLEFPERIRVWEDAVFHAHLFALYRSASFPEPVITIYRHANSLSHSLTLAKEDRLKTVDLVFNPAILPQELMPLRSEWLGRIQLSLFHLLYAHGEYEEARQAFHRALRVSPTSIMRFKALRRYLKAFLHVASARK